MAIRRLSFFFAAVTVVALLAFEIAITAAVASGAGKVTNYSGAGISGPPWIAVGPDRKLWFTNQTTNSIGRITATGHVTNYTGTGISGPDGIAAGSDGALWFSNERNNSIGRITITGHVTNYTGTGISGPDEIAAGPDGALWFSNVATSAIGRITTVGQVTIYTGSGINQPKGLTTGPDGAVWFTNEGSASIGRIDEAGNVTTFTGPGIDIPFGIVDGPDGALWFTNHGNSSIGRITTAGQVTNYTGSGVNSQPKKQLDRADHHHCHPPGQWFHAYLRRARHHRDDQRNQPLEDQQSHFCGHHRNHQLSHGHHDRHGRAHWSEKRTYQRHHASWDDNQLSNLHRHLIRCRNVPKSRVPNARKRWFAGAEWRHHSGGRARQIGTALDAAGADGRVEGGVALTAACRR